MGSGAEPFTLPDWRVEQLRLSAFPDTGETTRLARGWWIAVTDSEPDNVVEEPRNRSVRLQGRLAEAPLCMIAGEGRLDIRRFFEGLALSPPLPKFDDAIRTFVQLAIRWLNLDTVPPIRRLAFGAVVIKPSVELADCREVLRGYLPSIDLENTELRDFLYQVNRRRFSKVIDNLEVNRLMRWSIHCAEDIDFSPATGDVVRKRVFVSRLEVDINSAQEHSGRLNSDRRAMLFEEFVGLADQIARKGDHP